VGQENGLRAAVAWLAFPPLLATVSTGTTDVTLAAMLAIAVLLWRRPGASTAVLTAAAWFKLAPLALLPVWLAPLRGRRLMVALGGVLAVSLPLVLTLFWLGGSSGPMAMVHALAFQFQRSSPTSIWASPVMRPLQPLVQACVLGLIAGAAVTLRREPLLAADRARIAALAAAIMIGLELAADYWSFLYAAWVMPLLCLSLLAAADPAQVEVQDVVSVAGALSPEAAVAG
jgi:hypothetical protein